MSSESLYSGFLKKKGAVYTAWRERWFELKGHELSYFKTQKSKTSQGSIDISGAEISEPEQLIINKKKTFIFFIGGPCTNRTFELAANTKEIADGWVNKLREVVKSLPPVDSSATAQAQNGKKKKDSVASQIFQHPSQDKDGKEVGLQDFDLLTVIGRGSFGKVMKVRLRGTNEIYAMKVLKKDAIIKDNMISHILAEKAILAKVHHPFVVSLKWAFQTDEKLYLILDFLSGGELFFHLQNAKNPDHKFTEDRARFYAAEIAAALDHLHSLNIIYRDLKPENIVLDKDGHACITDFGLAKTGINADTSTSTFCGTPEYIAPEILRNTGHGQAVDWWSLGILVFEMLTGLPPFYSENINEMYEFILKGTLKFPSYVSAEAQDLIRALLEKDQEKRLGTRSTDDIKKHPWFRCIDWEKLARKEIPPPFIPDSKSVEKDEYFDKDFTSERVRDTVSAPVRDPKASAQFEGFQYSRDAPSGV